MRAIFIIGASSSISISADAIIAIGALRTIRAAAAAGAARLAVHGTRARHLRNVVRVRREHLASDCSASELPVGLSVKESESGSQGSNPKSRSSLSAE